MRPLGPPHLKLVSPYQPGKPISELRRELGLEGEIVKLASNENALGPSPKALAAVERALREMHRYPDGGSWHLRAALAARTGVPPSRIVLGCGSNELIDLIVRVFVGPDDHAVIGSLGFAIYRIVLQQCGRRFSQVPFVDCAYDLDAMADAVEDDTTVVFIDSPNNPTGSYVGEAALRRFLGRIPDDVLVVMDEAYAELVSADDFPDSIALQAERPRTVTLRTFAKVQGLAGLRLGWGVAPEEVADLLQRARQPFNCSALAQVAGLAALDDDEHVEATRRLVSEGKAQLEAGFSALGLRWEPTQANFLLVHVGREAQAVYQAMLRRAVIVRPLGAALPESLRITIGTARENARCLDALGEALEETAG